VVGFLLMLPIGLIVAFLLIYFVAFKGGYFPGEILLILLVVFLGLFVARMAFWRSRKRYRRERWRENEPVRILRERYARGEISREQFDQMMKDLERGRRGST
jgi:putative membrane protein